MRYCPKCQTLEEAGESPACPQCGSVLEDMNTLTADDLDRPIVLTVCPTPEQATVLRMALAQQGIDAIIEDEGLLEAIAPYHGNLNAGPRVMVRLGDAEDALDFIRRKNAGELALTKDDVPAESEDLRDEPTADDAPHPPPLPPRENP
jgi:hypothetical protein